jgi:hypothetical protein
MSISTQKKNSSIDYRRIEVDSFSTLKDFDKDGVIKYWRKYILKEKQDEDKSEALILGDLVDCLIYSSDEYPIKFVESNTSELVKGKTHMADFAIELWRLTKESSDDEGIMTREFSDIAEEAYNNVKYDYNGIAVKFLKKTFDQVIEDFTGSKEEEWYKLKRCGKTIINLSLKTKAEKIITRLKQSDATYKLFYPDDNSDEEHVNQLQIEFELFGLPFKSMPDDVIINHKRKLISPFDLKVSWMINAFEHKYLENRYHLQAACYDAALRHQYPGYDVNPINFIVADSSNDYEPVVYELEKEDVEVGYEGFTLNGRQYKGVKQLVKEVLFARENGIWTQRMDDHMNKGRRKLNINYD